jgi:hypothetical protein
MSRTPPCPLLLHCLCAYLGVTAAAERQLWGALFHSRWSRAAALRQELAYLDTRPDGAAKLELVGAVFDTLTPKRLVDVVEALMREKRLARPAGRTIEACILAHVDRHGAWYVPQPPAQKRS